jgi:AcrR family transcriptional regulator
MEQKEKTLNKKKALLDATLFLVNNKGFHDAPMSKIAKIAKVSPATIYLYFENKQDLINQLYLKVKASYCEQAFIAYENTVPVKKGFEIIWYNIAHYKLNNIDEALFLAHCDVTPMIDQDTKLEGLKHLEPLLDLWKKGQEEEVIKDISPYLLYAYTLSPLSFLMTIHNKDSFVLNEENIKNAFQLSWDSIKK